MIRLHSIRGKGQNDMEIEKIFNVEKYKKMFEAQRQSSVCGNKTIKSNLFPDTCKLQSPQTKSKIKSL